MANDQLGVYEFVGATQAVLSSSDAMSLYASGNINVRRGPQKSLYSRLVTETAIRDEVGEAPKTAYVNFDSPFTVSSCVTSYADQLATPPSWTQIGIGKKHGFVIPALSSSDHEISRLNAYASGPIAFENSAVPASGTLYYSKSSRFVRKVYKLSASAGIPVYPTSSERPPYSGEIAGRPSYVATSGSFVASSMYNPAIFEINVPDRGKIRDIKVWVELIHDYRGGANLTTASGTFGLPIGGPGLARLQIALRSPNVQFEWSHPTWNDAQTRGRLSTLSDQFYEGTTEKIPEILTNSYLLWDGYKDSYLNLAWGLSSSLIASDFTQVNGPGTARLKYGCWDDDRDLRTIFSDASSIPNPLHIDEARERNSPINILSASSPNHFAYSVDPNSVNSPPSHQGRGIPWMLDRRLGSGSLKSFVTLESVLGTSPPRGWLTGPAQTADVNEFPTTGSQLGPSTIRPVYPLLEDIFGERIYREEITLGPPESLVNNRKVFGFRPGLRGTEVNGKWKLLISTGFEVSGSSIFDGFPIALPTMGIWFRQFRLEVVLDQGEDADYAGYHSKSQRFQVPSNVPTRPGTRHLLFKSGSAFWTTGVESITVNVPSAYGRSIGITDQTGSARDDFAVFSRITGSLSSSSSLLYTYLHNEFGTPFIPISSGSGLAPSFDSFDSNEIQMTREIVNSVLRPSTTVPPANTAQSHVSRAGVVIDRRQAIENMIDSMYSSEVFTSGTTI